MQLGEGIDKARCLLVSSLELAPKPSIFTMLDFTKMDVPLTGCELTGVPDSGQKAGRLLLLLRAPHPLCTLPYFLM